MSDARGPIGTASAQLALWSEFVPFEQVRAQLPIFEAQGLSLNLAIRDGEWERPELEALWREAGARGVEIRAWLLLSREEGYWPNKWNAPRFEALVRRFLARMDDKHLPVFWLIFDLEPPPELMKELSRQLAKGQVGRALATLRRSSESAPLQPAVARFAALVEELHARGIRSHAVTTPMALHDLGAAPGPKVQSALGLPLEGVPWDLVSFMVYRPEYRRLVGELGPDIVYRYARDARRHFGSRVAIDLGEVGHVSFPEPFEGYVEPRLLGEDVSAVLAAGITQVQVYSLDGMLGMHAGPLPWIQSAKQAAPVRPRFSLKASLIRGTVTALRRLLP